MASLYEGYDYYKKMLELQEKLQKSEKERIRLEERFKALLQETRSRHDACINRLRLRYIEFLEEQRSRDERNHKLLGTLDRVDSSLSLMTAKTERLNVLRKQYEAYLLRVYANRGLPGSITGDSGIASQNEDRFSKRSALAGHGNMTSSEIKKLSSPQTFQPNYQSNQSVSLPATCEPVRDIPYNSPRTNINYGQVSYQSQNIPQMQVTSPAIQQCPVTYLPPPQQFLPQIFQNVQTVPGNNSDTRSLCQDFQSNPNPHAQYVTFSAPQAPSLNQQVSQFNMSPTGQVEGIQTTPRIVTHKPTDANIPQNEMTSPISQQYFHPPSGPQTARYLRDNVMPEIRNNGEMISPALRFPVMNTDSRVSRVTPLNAPSSTIKQVGPLPRFLDYSLENSENLRRSAGEIPARSLTSADIDDMINKNDRFVSKHLYTRKAPQKLSTFCKQVSSAGDEGKTTITLENELDRYIGKIRNLHRELDMQSLEELDHEQNTSGDLLNVTLSDDDLDLPTENKQKDEQFPEEVEKVLALASDLALSGGELDDVKHSEKQAVLENRNVELTQVTKSSAPVSERRHTVLSSMNEGHEPSVEVAKDGISSDISLRQPKLDERRYAEKLEEQKLADLDNTRESRLREQDMVEKQEDYVAPLISRDAEPEKKDNLLQNMEEINLAESDNNLQVEAQAELEQNVFDVPEELDPRDFDQAETRVEEMQPIVDSTETQEISEANIASDSNVTRCDDLEAISSVDSTTTEIKEQVENAGTENTTLHNKAPVSESKPENEELDPVENTASKKNNDSRPDDTADLVENEESNITNADQNVLHPEEEHKSHNDEQKIVNNSDVNINQIEPALVTEENKVDSAHEVHNEELNKEQDQVQDPNQKYDDLNQDYAYEQGVPYDGNPEQQYQEYSAQDYAQASGEQYGDYMGEQYQQYSDNVEGQYEQDPNAQYAQDPNAQYGHDPNAQYEQDPNAYEQDPNQQYEQDPNQQYEQDPNQQYEQDPNQQYEQDPNQQYEQDPNQQYEQDPNQQYAQDPNQQYDYNYDQQYDSTEAYKNDPSQSYAYDNNTTYEPNQTEVAQEQELTQNQNSENIQEDSKDQASEQVSEEKSDSNPSGNREEPAAEDPPKKKKDVIKSILDSDTDSTIERNVSNTESDFDFN